MITEKARIVAINEKDIWLESQRYSACDACKVKSGCGQKVINEMSGGKRNLIKIPHDSSLQNSKIDDIVALSIEESSLLLGSLLLYIFPLLLMLSGAFLAGSLFPSIENSDIASIVGAGSGFLIAFLIIRLHALMSSHSSRYRPSVCRIVDEGQN